MAPRTLADDLRARTDDELAALLRSRPDLSVPVPVDIAQLASRAATRASAIRALDRLDRFTLQVVDALAILPTPASAAQVRGALGGAPSAAVRSALATLRVQALTWGTATSHQLVRVVHDIIGPHPAGLGPPTRQVMLAMTPSRLNTITANLGINRTGDHTGHADPIAARFADQADLTALLEQLGDNTAPVLQALAAGPPTGRVENAHRDITRPPNSPIDELLRVGLIAPVADDTVVLPREVGMQLRGGVHATLHVTPPSLDTAQRDSTTADRTAGAGAFDLTRKVETLLETWGHEPPPVLRTGGLGVRELRRLPNLLDTDETGAALIADLAFTAGLLAPSSSVDEEWLPTPAYDSWLREEVSARWASLAYAWITSSRVPGLVGSRDDRDRLVPMLGRDLDRPVAPEIRRLTLGVLAELTGGSAPTEESVVERVRWLRPRRGGRLRDDLVRWTLREAETLGLTGMGALASFARPLLDGRAPEKAMTAATEAVQSVLPEPLNHVLLQADLTAVAPGPLRSDIARELGLLSDVESRGGASVHRFTADSLRRALDHGRTADDIHEFFTTVSRTPVPQPLTYLVNDVARRHGILRVGSAGSFVRCDDPATLTEIMAHTQATAFDLRRLAPTVLASSLDATTLLERLRQLGFTPMAEGADGTIVVTRPQVRRATNRQPPQPLISERPTPDETLLGAAVRAVRAGEKAAASRPRDYADRAAGRSASAQTIADLRNAIEAASTVWIGYVDQHGASSERVIDPFRLEGGWLAAFDHRTGAVRSFAVHRIRGVAQAS